MKRNLAQWSVVTHGVSTLRPDIVSDDAPPRASIKPFQIPDERSPGLRAEPGLAVIELMAHRSLFTIDVDDAPDKIVHLLLL